MCIIIGILIVYLLYKIYKKEEECICYVKEDESET
jgi:hypothetical protein